MEASIVVILNKDFEMVMDYGKWVQTKMIKNIKDIIAWIKNLGMVNILGQMDGSIKETFKMIRDKGMDNYLIINNVFLGVNGIKEIK